MSTIQTKILKPKLGFSKTAWECASRLWAAQEMYFTVLRNYIKNGGEEALHEISKKKPLTANRVSEDIKRAVIGIVTELPAYKELQMS